MGDTASYLDLRVMDLFERAMCLGYDEGAAAQLADCFEDYGYGSVDACPKHPNHSTVRDHNGYAVDMCAACHVIILSDGEGYYPGKWADVQATREAEYVAIMERQIAASFAAGQCACDLIMEMGGQRLPEGGRVCLVCGSLFTATGTEASPEVLAESERIVKGKTSLTFHATQDSEFLDTLKELLTLEPVKASVRHEVGPTGKTHCGRTLATNGTGRACKSCARVKRVETGQTYADVRAAREAEVIKVAEAVPATPECRSTNHVYCVGPCPQRDRNRADEVATRTHVETERECVARIAREDFRVGDVVTFRTTTGYKLSQNRPWSCSTLCQCGTCNGVTTVTEQRLTQVIHWVSGGLDIRGAGGGYRTVRPDRLD